MSDEPRTEWRRENDLVGRHPRADEIREACDEFQALLVEGGAALQERLKELHDGVPVKVAFEWEWGVLVSDEQRAEVERRKREDGAE